MLNLDAKHDFFHQRRSDEDEYGYLRKVKYSNSISLIDPLGNEDIEHFLTKKLGV